MRFSLQGTRAAGRASGGLRLSIRGKTERDWMRRNFPEFRPRDLFPEDGWEQSEIKTTSMKEGE